MLSKVKMTNINYFKNRSPLGFSEIIEKYKTQSPHREVGVIDWWGLDNREYTLQELRKFLEYQDIIFFYSSEILNKYDDKKSLYDVSTLANKYNVYYVIHSTDERFVLPEDVSRRFEVPWFVKGLSPVYVPSNFTDSIKYTEKKYAFSMLLGKDKPNRTILYRALGNNPNFYSTYFGHSKFKEKSNLDYEAGYMKKVLLENNLNTLDTCAELEIEGKSYTASHIIPANIFNNSHFSLISETNCLKPEHFLTEKTGNQLLCSRFFLWFTSPNVTIYLHRYGIDLEDWLPWIEYDRIEDDIKRMSLLIDTAEEIASSTLLQKEIYSKTKLSRRNNRLRYMDLVRQYESDMEDWVSNLIRTPSNITLI